MRRFVDGDMDDPEQDQQLTRWLSERENAAYREKWSRVLREDYDVRRRPKRQSSIWFHSMTTRIAAAASIAVLLFVGYQWLGTSSELSSVEWAQTHLENERFVNADITKDISQGEGASYRIAASAFNAGAYGEARSQYEALLEKAPSNRTFRFFYGLSALYQEDLQTAVSAFEALLASSEDQSNFEEESRWFLILAYIKNGEEERARTLLRGMSERHWNYAEAQALLRLVE